MQAYILEPRFSDGTLNPKHQAWGNPTFSPFMQGAKKDKFFSYYFVKNPKVTSVDWETVNEWFKAQGLHIRPKTW